MVTIKSYSDLQQSKKLAKILPLESADMSFVEKGNAKHTWYDAENKRITTAYEKKYYIPCWSLAALLKVISNIFKYNLDYNGALFILTVGDFEVSNKDVVDACYEMILKLHELKML